jgi:hypothetical protein
MAQDLVLPVLFVVPIIFLLTIIALYILGRRVHSVGPTKRRTTILISFLTLAIVSTGGLSVLRDQAIAHHDPEISLITTFYIGSAIFTEIYLLLLICIFAYYGPRMRAEIEPAQSTEPNHQIAVLLQ